VAADASSKERRTVILGGDLRVSSEIVEALYWRNDGSRDLAREGIRYLGKTSFQSRRQLYRQCRGRHKAKLLHLLRRHKTRMGEYGRDRKCRLGLGKRYPLELQRKQMMPDSVMFLSFTCRDHDHDESGTGRECQFRTKPHPGIEVRFCISFSSIETIMDLRNKGVKIDLQAVCRLYLDDRLCGRASDSLWESAENQIDSCRRRT
jgi:hypothetical protein